jgi:hypothetical protein
MILDRTVNGNARSAGGKLGFTGKTTGMCPGRLAYPHPFADGILRDHDEENRILPDGRHAGLHIEFNKKSPTQILGSRGATFRRERRFNMKRLMQLMVICFVLAIFGLAMAQGPGYGRGGGPWYDDEGYYCPYCGQPYGQRGWGMGPGMMGRGGMMGPGWGGRGYYRMTPECQKAFDETAPLRRELYSKRFDYREALRNPKTSNEMLNKMEKEMDDLHEKIYAKIPRNCW